MFPPGPYVTHCRGIDEITIYGGDDDHHNTYYFVVSPWIADGTSAPDFYIHLWDGDNNASGTVSGTQDYNAHGSGQGTRFEYRLYGGPGAYDTGEPDPGVDPTTWGGTLIDIDSDEADLTLRTDEPGDTDGNSPEDLRDQDFSLIGVDIDANWGDYVSGQFIYRFVVDSSTTGSSGADWNRYELQITRDAARTDTTDLRIAVYELTFAGRPDSSSVWTNLAFRIPPTATDEIDIQTLDLDYQDYSQNPRSTVTTPSLFYDDTLTYESGQQYVGGWMWTSLNQLQSTRPNGDGITGVTYPTTEEEGMLWTLDVDAGTVHNPFSIRLHDVGANWLPLYFDPVFQAYGTGPIALGGTGLPRPGGPSFTIEATNGPANALGLLLVSDASAEIPFGGVVLYVDLAGLMTDMIPVPLNGSGAGSYTTSLPSGFPAMDVYLQLGAIDAGSIWYSNGLRMAIVPE